MSDHNLKHGQVLICNIGKVEDGGYEVTFHSDVGFTKGFMPSPSCGYRVGAEVLGTFDRFDHKTGRLVVKEFFSPRKPPLATGIQRLLNKGEVPETLDARIKGVRVEDL